VIHAKEQGYKMRYLPQNDPLLNVPITQAMPIGLDQLARNQDLQKLSAEAAQLALNNGIGYRKKVEQLYFLLEKANALENNDDYYQMYAKTKTIIIIIQELNKMEGHYHKNRVDAHSISLKMDPDTLNNLIKDYEKEY
jgi:hypothetical protein